MRSIPWRFSSRKRGQLVPVIVLCVATAAFATEPTASSVPADAIAVTWPEIVQMVDRHPRLVAGRLQIAAARAAAMAAGAVPNPTLEATLGQGRARAGDARRSEWGLALAIPFGWMGQRGSRVDAARAEVAAVEAESAALRREVLLELRTRFWQLAYEQARVASFEALATATTALVRTVQARVEKGETRPIESTRVEIELEKVQAELDEARTSLAARRAGLALWLRPPAGRALAARADLAQLPSVMGLPEALARTRATHPAVLTARSRTRVRAAELDVERLARVPTVSLKAFLTSELDRQAIGAGLAVDLPVWNWNGGGIAQAQARLTGSRRQAEAVALELEGVVIETQAACHAQVLTASRLGNAVIPRSEATAATMERTYQLGETSLLEVIDARRTAIEARRLFLASLVRAQIDCSRLGVLVGEELP